MDRNISITPIKLQDAQLEAFAYALVDFIAEKESESSTATTVNDSR